MAILGFSGVRGVSNIIAGISMMGLSVLIPFILTFFLQKDDSTEVFSQKKSVAPALASEIMD
jgi:PTS system beta-glucosides-specific IIC component